jgi:hypothetical protein
VFTNSRSPKSARSRCMFVFLAGCGGFGAGCGGCQPTAARRRACPAPDRRGWRPGPGHPGRVHQDHPAHAATLRDEHRRRLLRQPGRSARRGASWPPARATAPRPGRHPVQGRRSAAPTAATWCRPSTPHHQRSPRSQRINIRVQVDINAAVALNGDRSRHPFSARSAPQPQHLAIDADLHLGIDGSDRRADHGAGADQQHSTSRTSTSAAARVLSDVARPPQLDSSTPSSASSSSTCSSRPSTT